MRACLLLKPGVISVAEIDTPRPKRGEMLVRVKAALTCGTDLKAFLRGHPMIPMPGPFGHEFSGTVEKLGAGVKGFKAGDAVMAVHSAPCLKCNYCKTGAHNLCEDIMGTKVMGAFAEYVLLPARIVKQNVYKKPRRLSFEEAAFLEPLSCVVHGTAPLSIKKGSTALIIGSGPIGLLHLLLLRSMGVSVYVSDTHSGRLTVARKLGAAGTFRAGKINPPAPGFDYVFECTGLPDVWEKSVEYSRRGGTIVLFGGPRKGTKASFDTYRVHYDELTLRGTFHFTPQDVKTAYGLLSSGKIDVSALISGRCGLDDMGRHLKKLSEGKGIKYAIAP